jgi:hypothetical protein
MSPPHTIPSAQTPTHKHHTNTTTTTPTIDFQISFHLSPQPARGPPYIPYDQCVGCHEDFPTRDLSQMLCDCHYCTECLEGMVRAQLGDTGFRLPQCCGHVFEWEELQEVISPELAAEFDKKRQDFEDTIPVYCPDKTCPGSAALIGAEHQSAADETATCPICDKVVCTKCKQDVHPDRECVADAAEEETLALSKKEGWQRCSRCGEMVDRELGCSHMK